MNGIIGSGSNTWGPFQIQPRPVIAGQGTSAVLAFAADSGIMLSITTNRGLDWRQPVRISGSLAQCDDPYVGVFENAYGARTAYVLFIAGEGDSVFLYRSDTIAVRRLSPAHHLECSNPIASVMAGQMRVAYECLDKKYNRQYVAQTRYDLLQRHLEMDCDVYGVKNQRDINANRNPSILHTEPTSTERFMLAWEHNNGEKLLITTLEDLPQASVIQGYESSLSTCVTSYPYLLPYEPENPRIVVTRSGRLLPAQSAVFPDTLPAVVSLSWNEDRLRNPKELDKHSSLELDFASTNQLSLHVTLDPAVVLNAPDTLSRIQYDYMSSYHCEGQEMNTVTKTQVFPLSTGQVGVIPVTVAYSEYDSDTLIVEARLFSAGSENLISSSGEVKIPPMTGDTSFALFVEAPVGQPPAEYVMRTTMRRGMFGETAPIPDAVTRYFLFSEPVAAKAHEFTSPGPIASQNITMYPHPAHGLVPFSFEKNDAVAATVYDLVGRRVIEADVRSIGSGSVGTINTTGLRTGSYILVIRTPDKVYTRMMEVLQ